MANDLKVNLDGNSSGFERMLNTAKVQAKAFGNTVSQDVGSSWGNIGKMFAGGIAGALSFEAVKGFVKDMFETAKSVKDISEQYDISTDAVQKWEKAVNKAGVGTATFYRTLETFRQKRADAVGGDTKAQSLFNAAGMGDDIYGNKDDAELIQKLLEGNSTREQQRDLLGTRGPRLKAALKFLKKAPLYTEDDIAGMSSFSDDMGSLYGTAKGVGAMAVMGAGKLFNPKNWGDILGQVWDSAFNSNLVGQGSLLNARRESLERLQHPKPGQPHHYKFDNKAELEAQSIAERKATIEERLEKVRREGMAPLEKRKSIENELTETRKKIKGFGSEFERDSNEDLKVGELKIREAQLMNELKADHNKPMDFHASQLSRVGLYSGGALGVNGANPGGGTDGILRQIAFNTDPRHRRDPHAN